MSLIPVTQFTQFTSSETIFLAALADHSYSDGQLIIGNGLTHGISFATLTAGSGISITNGHGTITITSTAGAGVLIPTGTVNGSNTTFVFTTAPNIIVLDNGNMMNKVSSDGTVNWTGTTTVVLTQAPNFNIYGF